VVFGTGGARLAGAEGRGRDGMGWATGLCSGDGVLVPRRGLVSLAERVALAGGTLAHGPDDGGDFVLTAAFPWEG
jgi:hypothetical protein